MTGVAHDPSTSTATTFVASVHDLKVHFRSKAGTVSAVDGVSFQIADGETLGLVGETGCGKSVTARSFLGLVPMPPGVAAGGSIHFRPRTTCQSCSGRGCEACSQTGRAATTCRRCAGTGCDPCSGTGTETIELTDLAGPSMRDIRGNRIAMIFQDPGKALNPAMTIRDQVAEVFHQHRWRELLDDAAVAPTGRNLLKRFAQLRSRRIERWVLAVTPLRRMRDKISEAVDRRVAAALAETQIPNPMAVMDRYPHELSGGMRQRVMIAQALACDPDLLIADEPTTALDVTVQARIIDLISDLQQRHHTSVLYISHDLALVRRICDRVAVMYAGRIVEIGQTEAVFADPRHPYTRGLIGAIPSASDERGHLQAIEGTVPELIDPPAACRFADRCPHAAEACHSIDPPFVRHDGERGVACFLHHPPPTDLELPTAEWLAS